MKLNQHYQQLQDSYLFSSIAQKVNAHKQQHPHQEIIRLGIGDVTLPLIPAVITALQQAVSEMAHADTFHGYGEEQGYAFLRQAVCGYYAAKDVSLDENEVFISDGAKSDLGNILDLFDTENVALIPDPVYPAYVDTNIMAGRQLLFMNGTVDNGFLPLPDPAVKADLIYLCSPNNPTGAVYSQAQLTAWVDYALQQDAIILFDAAYELFVQDKSLPTSIFQIDGAKHCAIEFSSLSKTAGFTGTRCGYTVVPKELNRNGIGLNQLWLRRQCTKFNGVPYIVQRGAQAVFQQQGLTQAKQNIAHYLENARLMSETLKQLGIWFVGGENSPYVWLKCPNNMSSWDFFDLLLTQHGVVGTPGAGFGANGEGFFRLSAFGHRDHVQTAMDRLKSISF